VARSRSQVGVEIVDQRRRGGDCDRCKNQRSQYEAAHDRVGFMYGDTVPLPGGRRACRQALFL
jgi:hypothetical protein